MIIDTRDGNVREFYLDPHNPAKAKLSWDKNKQLRDGRIGAWKIHSMCTNDVWKDINDYVLHRGDYELVNYDE